MPTEDTVPARYWLFQNNQVLGPYDAAELSAAAGFGPDSLVCPEGRKGTQMGDWQRAEAVAELAATALKAAQVPAGASPGGGAAPAAQPAEQAAPQAAAQPAQAGAHTAALGTLQEKIAQLEGTVGKLQEDLKSRDGEISGLKDRLTEVQGQLAAKQAAPEPAANGGKVDPEALQELKAQLQSLRTQVANLEASQADLRKQALSAVKPPALEPTRVTSLPTLEAPAAMEIPGPSSGPHGLESLGQPIGLNTPIPQTLVNPAQPLDIPLPASSSETTLPMPGFTGSRDTPLPFKKQEPGSLEFVDLTAQPRGRRGMGLLFFLLLAAAAAGGLYATGRLNPLLGRMGGRIRPAAAGGEAPAMPVSGEAVSGPQEPGRGDLGGPDPTQAAIELARSARVGGKTLGSLLEGDAPRTGLSPWMAEKLSQGKVQVNYYAGGKKPRYQFEADLATGGLRGLDAASSALLAGAGAAKEPARGAKAPAGLLDDGDAASLLATSAEQTPEPPPRQRPRKRRRRRVSASASLEPTIKGDDGPASPAPAAAAPAVKDGGQDVSLDELLLPGGNK